MERVVEILWRLRSTDNPRERLSLADEAAARCSSILRQVSRRFVAKNQLPAIIDADDIAQESELRLLHTFRRKSFRIHSEEHLLKYLERTVTNVARDLLRWVSAGKRGGGETLALMSDVAGPQMTPDEREMYGEAIGAARDWLDSLAQEDQLLVRLKFDDEATFAEIADRLHRPFSWTYRRYRQLLDELEDELRDYL